MVWAQAFSSHQITVQQWGSSPRNCLGVASGILGTMRNVGMSLGIATGGMVLYSIVPASVMRSAVLGGADALNFLTGLSHAYAVGAILAGVAVITSLFGGKRGRVSIKSS